MALKLRRRFYGCELKDEYHATALLSCERAIHERDGGDQMTIMDLLDEKKEGSDLFASKESL